MLSASSSSNSSKTSQSVDSQSLQKLTDELIRGKPVKSVDKSIHPLLIPFLQDMMKKAMLKGNTCLGRKIDIILTKLTLSHQAPKTKKQKAVKDYYAFKKNTPESVSEDEPPIEYHHLVEKIINGKKKIEELEDASFEPICNCIKQKIVEATKVQDFGMADKLLNEIDNITKYAKSLPKKPKQYGNIEYIEYLKKLYVESCQKRTELKNSFKEQLDKLSENEDKLETKAMCEYLKSKGKLEDKENQIKNCENFQPSLKLLEMKKTLDRMTKAQLFKDAKEMKIKIKQLEEFEKSEFIKNEMIIIRSKITENEKRKIKQIEGIKDTWKEKNVLLKQKMKKQLRLAQDEIDAIAFRIELLGSQVPEMAKEEVNTNNDTYKFLSEIDSQSSLVSSTSESSKITSLTSEDFISRVEEILTEADFKLTSLVPKTLNYGLLNNNISTQKTQKIVDKEEKKVEEKIEGPNENKIVESDATFHSETPEPATHNESNVKRQRRKVNKFSRTAKPMFVPTEKENLEKDTCQSKEKEEELLNVEDGNEVIVKKEDNRKKLSYNDFLTKNDDKDTKRKRLCYNEFIKSKQTSSNLRYSYETIQDEINPSITDSY
ncbi:hypothetical protein TRFO_04784 [Tritrichomonas foetus]|uniref:Uncharacterized protein n=1 Tax=Tritrichomonas foetus TaxID=1144522 RepID=A0A1J4KG03_9EUKA|nr:hypothetical protein TRFO_04784 [Tritrichomonas foetus]|eukprot:OHT08708.1 hypothetical protein TRFO_04784 [Tritrichomonas foetus]